MTKDTPEIQPAMNAFPVQLEPIVRLLMPHYVPLVHQDTQHLKKEATRVRSVQVDNVSIMKSQIKFYDLVIIYLLFFDYKNQIVTGEI